jgi:hypothetical protein
MDTNKAKSCKKTFIMFFFLSASMCIHLWTIYPVMAQNTACKFDEKTLQFVGSPVEQARCLLRPNKIGGNLDVELKTLPKPLEKIIGEKVLLEKAKLRQFLAKNKIDEINLGGNLNEPLSTAKLPNGAEIQALYFIIHDTSSPYLKDEAFPKNFNSDKNWNGNKLDIWIKQPVAHVFVNRLGDSLTVSPFAQTVGKGWGTKFARDFLKADGKGFQIHIELHQPRRRDAKNSNPNNDLIAPKPGFTEKQYERLALLYVCASVRRGNWLIPAYHSAIDAGIKDAHDDPQNFELENFAKQIDKLLKKLA